MSKQTLAWHRECLTNHMRSIREKRAIVTRLIEDVERSEREAVLYQEQITAAEARGLDAFDKERLLRRAG